MLVAVESGRSLSLLVLHGTVPMVQGGNTYNIPTRIWLPYPYPREQPYCEVIPTATMEVNASAAYVEPSGRLRMPYLAQFNRQTDVRGVAHRYRTAEVWAHTDLKASLEREWGYSPQRSRWWP